MTQALVTIFRGIIDQVMFFEDLELAIQALSGHVKTMDLENDDAGLYDINGLIANAKHFLDNDDSYQENPGLIKELSQG